MAVRKSMAELLQEQEGAMGATALRPAPPQDDLPGVIAPAPGRAREVSAPPKPAPAVPPRARTRSKSARQAVTAARDSSRYEPQAWEQFTTMLPSGLRRRLLHRLAQDQADSGDYRLGLLHYLNAAYASIPHSPAADWIAPDDLADLKQWTPPSAVRLALAWRRRTAGPQKPIKSGSQLQGDVARSVRELGTLSKLLPYRVWAWEILAEALARLLDELDADQASA